MLKFFCPQFEIDLSHLAITLVEENARFTSTNRRNYSLPFSFDADNETEKTLGFINDPQSRKRTVKFVGKMQFLNRFENAILYLYSTSKGKIQAKIDFGASTLPLLETNLKDLPFKTVKVTNIIIHSFEVIQKNWPETSYNFPRIIDRNFYLKSNHEKFMGCINNQLPGYGLYNNGLFPEDGVPKVFNINAISPCVYVMEILKVGFDFANIVMVGDFVNDLANRRLVIYSQNHLESFNDDKVNEFLTEFALIDFLPEITFGTFLNKLRNWFNLDITYRKNMVTINYLERRFKNVDFKKSVHLENGAVDIKFNEKQAYQLMYDEQTKFTVDPNGDPAVISGLETNEIETIKMEMSFLRQGELDGFTTAEVLEDDEDFKVLYYNGLQEGANVTPDNVYGRNFSLPQIYDLFWKKWIQFRLNSTTFTDKYDTTNDDLDISEGIFKYQNKHLIKKITRKITHINDQENVDMTIETETIF